MNTAQELIALNKFEIEKLIADLEFTDLPPETTIAHQVYRINIAIGLDPQTALDQTIEDRAEDLQTDLEYITEDLDLDFDRKLDFDFDRKLDFDL